MSQLQRILDEVADPTMRMSAALQARQRLFGARPKGFGTGSGFEQSESGATRSVERHQGPSDGVRNAKSKERER